LISVLERARVGNGWARRLKFGRSAQMPEVRIQAFGRPAVERETKLSIEFPEVGKPQPVASDQGKETSAASAASEHGRSKFTA
jgi:hypothetical protein